MKQLPSPIFKKGISKISWEKIYEREYGVQYSEVAVSLFANASYHFPKSSVTQVVIPGSGNNTAFYIEKQSWNKLVDGLNKKYTQNLKNLREYEKQFVLDGENYLNLAKRISTLNLTSLSDKQLLSLFLDHQNKRYRYSTFAWSAFILNNYVADRAAKILDTYINRHNKENEKQDIYDSLFSPPKKAAVLELQYEVENKGNNLTEAQFNNLYNRFKWLSCLDIHNKPWSKQEFEKYIEPFKTASSKKSVLFEIFTKELQIDKKDLEYLRMAQRFVYIKDARDDYRRESVYYAKNLFEEIGRRMNLSTSDMSYLQEKEIFDFLSKNTRFDTQRVAERKKGFVIYLNMKKQLICLDGGQIKPALQLFRLLPQEENQIEISGRIACQGIARGPVKIVHGVKDLAKIVKGDVLVAVTTHPDFVSAMRKSVAIVTDEGGITSHAAIVSREFGIPCIVGCKNATKLLKDGNLVEVDANKGTVIKVN